MKFIFLFVATILASFNSYAVERVLLPQKKAERNMQEKMPIVDDDMWNKLAKAKIEFDENKAVFVAVLPKDVKDMSGQEVSIPGFMLPVEVNTKHTHFLLSKRTPTCPYCMPGGPSEVVDVTLKAPIEYTADLIHVTGRFKLTEDAKSGLYFHLENATIKHESDTLKRNIKSVTRNNIIELNN